MMLTFVAWHLLSWSHDLQSEFGKGEKTKGIISGNQNVLVSYQWSNKHHKTCEECSRVTMVSLVSPSVCLTLFPVTQSHPQSDENILMQTTLKDTRRNLFLTTTLLPWQSNGDHVCRIRSTEGHKDQWCQLLVRVLTPNKKHVLKYPKQDRGGGGAAFTSSPHHYLSYILSCLHVVSIHA